jgi:hypothetical protein
MFLDILQISVYNGNDGNIIISLLEMNAKHPNLKYFV